MSSLSFGAVPASGRHLINDLWGERFPPGWFSGTGPRGGDSLHPSFALQELPRAAVTNRCHPCGSQPQRCVLSPSWGPEVQSQGVGRAMRPPQAASSGFGARRLPLASSGSPASAFAFAWPSSLPSKDIPMGGRPTLIRCHLTSVLSSITPAQTPFPLRSRSEAPGGRESLACTVPGTGCRQWRHLGVLHRAPHSRVQGLFPVPLRKVSTVTVTPILQVEEPGQGCPLAKGSELRGALG